jgi:uncharacterized protein YbbC (DUF1343 family)
MENWTRRTWFDETGLPWVNPSPNIHNLNEAILYPGIGMLEYSTNYSVGRGTDAPFEQIGAEWIDGPRLAAFLNAEHLPGVSVEAVRFTPASSHLAGKSLSGVHFSVTDRNTFSSSQFGLALASALASLYPGKIDFDVNRKLIGNSAVISALDRSADVLSAANQGIPEFLAIRAKYLLYN